MSQTELLTISYEGSSIVDFLATIKQARVDIIIDVRDVPISRKAGFSKNALSPALRTNKSITFISKVWAIPSLEELPRVKGDMTTFVTYLTHIF
jgi:uncharacterized protein (DUF488 family)